MPTPSTEAGTLAASAAPPPAGSLDQLASYLTTGYWQDNGAGPRHFNTTTSNVIAVNLTGLTTAGQGLARMALNAWEMVANLRFTEVTSGARITFDDNQSGAFTNTTYSGSILQSATVNVSTNWTASYGTRLDGYSLQTFIHEIGHALGLGHQGNYDGNASYGADSTFANDSWQESVMSYFDQDTNPTSTADFAWLLTPMMADIVAIQSLYGVPGAGAAIDTGGATTWGAHSNLGGYLGAFFQVLTGTANAALYTGGPVAFTISDQGGNDTLDTSYSSHGDRIDLGAERFSDVGGVAGSIGIARGTVIENAVSGSGNDTITGNAVGNAINAGLGNDSVQGLGGADVLAGGTGSDSLFGGAGNDRIYGGLGVDYLTGGAGQDSLYAGADAVRDVFLFTALTDSTLAAAGRDTIYQFHSGQDRINLSVLDANTSLAGNQAFSLASVAAAHAIWLTKVGADIQVSGDVTGDGVADFAIIVAGVASLQALDFVL